MRRYGWSCSTALCGVWPQCDEVSVPILKGGRIFHQKWLSNGWKKGSKRLETRDQSRVLAGRRSQKIWLKKSASWLSRSRRTNKAHQSERSPNNCVSQQQPFGASCERNLQATVGRFAANMDPDDVRRAVRHLRRRVETCVRRKGGTVENPWRVLKWKLYVHKSYCSAVSCGNTHDPYVIHLSLKHRRLKSNIHCEAP